VLPQLWKLVARQLYKVIAYFADKAYQNLLCWRQVLDELALSGLLGTNWNFFECHLAWTSSYASWVNNVVTTLIFNLILVESRNNRNDENAVISLQISDFQFGSFKIDAIHLSFLFMVLHHPHLNDSFPLSEQYKGPKLKNSCLFFVWACSWYLLFNLELPRLIASTFIFISVKTTEFVLEGLCLQLGNDLEPWFSL